MGSWRLAVLGAREHKASMLHTRSTRVQTPRGGESGMVHPASHELTATKPDLRSQIEVRSFEV